MKTLFLSFLLSANNRYHIEVEYLGRDVSTGSKIYSLWGETVVYSGLYRKEILEFARTGKITNLEVNFEDMIVTNKPIYGFVDRPMLQLKD